MNWKGCVRKQSWSNRDAVSAFGFRYLNAFIFERKFCLSVANGNTASRQGRLGCLTVEHLEHEFEFRSTHG